MTDRRCRDEAVAASLLDRTVHGLGLAVLGEGSIRRVELMPDPGGSHIPRRLGNRS